MYQIADNILCTKLLSTTLSVSRLLLIAVKPSAKGKFLYFMFMFPCIVNLYYNNRTRSSCVQSILFYCRFTLHVSGAFHTHHQE